MSLPEILDADITLGQRTVRVLDVVVTRRIVVVVPEDLPLDVVERVAARHLGGGDAHVEGHRCARRADARGIEGALRLSDDHRRLSPDLPAWLRGGR